MAIVGIDLRKEQQATLDRPALKYSFMARSFFKAFDLAIGSRTTLPKLELLEILAGVPYHAWEARRDRQCAGFPGDAQGREQARRLRAWARLARDNEFRHLQLLREKSAEENLEAPWFLRPALVGAMRFSYRLFAWALAKMALRRSLLFNAEFEDHAEHVYAEFVSRHPEWEAQPVTGPQARAYGEFASWADLFRRVSLDERDHRNRSFYFCGRFHDIIRYQGMPENF